MKKYNRTIGVLAFLFSAVTFAGGGWPKQKGSTYVKVSGWWIESKNFFNGNGNESKSEVDTGLFNVNIYAEYGITDKLTAIAYIPFFSRSYQNGEIDQDGIRSPERPGGDLNSFGDSEIGLKYGLYKNSKIALAGSIILGLPLGNDGSDETLPLATGDGEFNQIARVDLGISIYNSESASLYGNIYTGYNNRTEGFSDEFRGGVELGLGLLKNKLFLVGKLDTIQSFENGAETGQGSASSIFANNTEVVNITTEVAYYLTSKIGVSGSFSNPVSGKNVFADPAYNLGVFLDL
ncbi:hypothetical protein ACXGQW_11085 [Wenyingzhuangia sp. IMCC45533]